MLVAAVLPYFDKQVKSLAELILWILLNNQFVEWEGRTYKVDRGSGMGLIHSGCLSDLAFNRVVESRINFAEVGIRAYYRFRDDIFLVADSKQHVEAALVSIRRLASPHWVVTAERPSAYSASMLDTLV